MCRLSSLNVQFEMIQKCHLWRFVYECALTVAEAKRWRGVFPWWEVGAQWQRWSWHGSQGGAGGGGSASEWSSGGLQVVPRPCKGRKIKGTNEAEFWILLHRRGIKVVLVLSVVCFIFKLKQDLFGFILEHSWFCFNKSQCWNETLSQVSIQSPRCVWHWLSYSTLLKFLTCNLTTM